MGMLIPIFLTCCGALFFLIIAALLYVMYLYNAIQRQIVLVDEAWSGIDVQLKKRFDLIPNLVQTVKGYAKHEQETFEKVTALRAQMQGVSTPEQLGKIEGEFRSAMKSLFAVAENYPELKADQNFLQLQGTLQEIEGELEGARRYYNGSVRDLNHHLVTFPNNIIAGVLKLEKRQFFEVSSEAERENVKVDFSN